MRITSCRVDGTRTATAAGRRSFSTVHTRGGDKGGGGGGSGPYLGSTSGDLQLGPGLTCVDVICWAEGQMHPRNAGQ